MVTIFFGVTNAPNICGSDIIKGIEMSQVFGWHKIKETFFATPKGPLLVHILKTLQEQKKSVSEHTSDRTVTCGNLKW